MSSKLPEAVVKMFLLVDNAKITCWNKRRTVFQYFKKLITSTEKSNSPIAVPVGLIFSA
jgi:hypothetical protein